MTHCGKLKRCCTLVLGCFAVLLVIPYITLIVYSAFAVNDYKNIEVYDRCIYLNGVNFKPTTLGAYFAIIYMSLTISILLAIKIVSDMQTHGRHRVDNCIFILFCILITGLTIFTGLLSAGTIFSQCFKNLFDDTYIMPVIYVCVILSFPFCICATVIWLTIFVFATKELFECIVNACYRLCKLIFDCCEREYLYVITEPQVPNVDNNNLV